MLRSASGFVPVLLLCAGLAHGADDEFCSTLKHVRADAMNQFAAVKGASKSKSRWFVHRSLPGFAECTIWTSDDGSLNYNCSTPLLASETMAKGEVWKVTAAIERCLGDAVELLGKERTGTPFLRVKDGQANVMIYDMPMVQHDPATNKFNEGNVVVVSLSTPSAEDDEEGSSDEPVKEGTPTTLPASAAFCPKLKQVVAAAEKSFDPILGKQDNRGNWDSKLLLPSMSRCKINAYSDKRRYYDCDFSSQPDQKSSTTDFDGLSQLTAGCLGEDWGTKVRTDKDGLKRIEFWRGDTLPTVQVRQGQLLEYTVDLHVDMPD